MPDNHEVTIFDGLGNPTKVKMLDPRDTTADRIAKLEAERDEAMREATSLAIALHRRWYSEVTQWRPITDSVAGVISQVDNMSAGIGRRLDEAGQRIAKLEAALAEAIEIIEGEWPGKWMPGREALGREQ